MQTAPDILGEAKPARSRQGELWRWSKGQKRKPIALGGPGDSELHLLGAFRSQSSFSVHRQDKQIEREEEATNHHLANQCRIQDLTPAS